MQRRIYPNFDRLRTALFCGEPDRVPLVELIVDPEVKETFLGKPVKDFKESIEFHKKAGYDYYIVRFSYIGDFGVGSFSDQPWGPITFTRSLHGSVRKERHWLKGRNGAVTSMKDFERFPWPEPRERNMIAGEPGVRALLATDAIKIIEGYLPKEMRLIGWTSGIYEYVVWLMGYENLCLSFYDTPKLVERMFEKIGSLMVSIFEFMTKIDLVGALWLADDLAYATGLLWSPELMRKFLFPWYREIGSIAKKAGLPLIFHSDGKLGDVIPDLIQAGINALHPIEPKAMDILEFKRDYGEELCLVGNIDLNYTLTRGTPGEVEVEVKDKIRNLAPGGGYCLGSSNSITDYVPLRNYKTMIETALRYGEYPILM